MRIGPVIPDPTDEGEGAGLASDDEHAPETPETARQQADEDVGESLGDLRDPGGC